MKDPFNPIPIPESLNLSLNAETAQEQAPQKNPKPERKPKRKPRRKSTKSNPSGGKTFQADSESRWNRTKDRLTAKVAAVDKEKIRALLLACGVAAGVVAAVIVAIKLLPVAAVIVAALGFAAALRFWERLRYIPRPF